MTPLADLLRRVEAAEGPDRELDAAICAALKYLTGSAVHSWAANWTGPWEARGRQVHLLASDGRSNGNFTSASVTASLDAALALVERVVPGHGRFLLSRATTEVFMDTRPDLVSRIARALVAAMLKALIAQQVAA